MEFKVVHKGIDSLYISYRGSFKDGLVDSLESLKQLARSNDIRDQAQAKINIGGHCFEVKDKGSGVFNYVIIDNWFHIKIAGARSKKLPALYVQVSSELLNCRGVEDSMKQLRALADELLHDNYEEKLSRADIFIDFVTDENFGEIDVDSWISSARRINEFWEGNNFTGWSIGGGGDISARLYDKTIEIETSHKEWFKEIWIKQGWQDGQRVIRLEFELKRLFLFQIKIETVSDLKSKLNDVWNYCTHDWLRLAEDNGDDNRSRWPTSSMWVGIQQITFNDNGLSGITRDVSKSRSPNLKILYINGLGYLLSYAALNGYDCSNLAEAARSFLRDAGMYLDACFLNDEKMKRIYVDGIDYVNKKINLKKTRFNKPDDADNVPF